MAKKKTRSSRKKKDTSYLVEIWGILCIIAAILGICKYGLAGKVIASFFLLLVGNLYVIFLAVLFIIGIIIMVKRTGYNLFSSKMIGIYLFTIGILVLMHQKYVLGNNGTDKIFTETIDYIMLGIDKIMNGGVTSGVFNEALSNTGGGILGAIFGAIFYSLFDTTGTKIVSIVLMICGFMIFTGFSIRDLLVKTKEGAKKIGSSLFTYEDDEEEEKPKKRDDLKIVDHTTDVGKLVVHDIKELTKKPIDNEKPKDEGIQSAVNKNYVLPTLDMLEASKAPKEKTDHKEVEKNIGILEQVLQDFGIKGKVVEVNIGPTVTQYELSLSSGTRVSKIVTINKEIALALAKKDVRIQAPIPGKSTVGIEMPNEKAQAVTIRETLEAMPSSLDSKPLAVALGKDILGRTKWCEINKTPHLLVAGSTGSGKSVCINTMIISILMKARPDEVKLIMVDPKKVELGIYNGIPHLLMPVVTDPRKASLALKKAVSEMERRYDLFEESGTKNIEGYNKLVESKNKKLSEDEQMSKLPYIVVIVDELADLMLVAGKEVEDSIMRITQMARAAGIHLVIATQRPSTDVITGLIKSNIPSRIAFAVSSSIDSRTILDMVGAEKLLGKGDMLFLPMGENTPERIQGAFISEEYIKKIVDYTISQQKAQYDSSFTNLEQVDEDRKNNPISNDKEEYDDPLYNEIVEFVIESGKASASLLQRRFKIGYNRAARVIDLLEERGIIGPQNGSKPREVLVKLEGDEQ